MDAGLVTAAATATSSSGSGSGRLSRSRTNSTSSVGGLVIPAPPSATPSATPSHPSLSGGGGRVVQQQIPPEQLAQGLFRIRAEQQVSQSVSQIHCIDCTSVCVMRTRRRRKWVAIFINLCSSKIKITSPKFKTQFFIYVAI